MRRLAILVLLLSAVFTQSARANAFGQFIPASPLRGGDNLFGVYLLFGDRVGDDLGVLGQVRLSSGPKFDWGLQFGFAGSNPSAILIGGDIRPILHAADDNFPLDLAFDAGVGLSIADNITIIEFVPAIEGSDGVISATPWMDDQSRNCAKPATGSRSVTSAFSTASK